MGNFLIAFDDDDDDHDDHDDDDTANMLIWNG